jgi:tripartite-type tricarboxylate transporter receptor subunit TctC
MKKILFALLCIATATVSIAQDIRIIVPFAAGGPADRIARMIQKDLKELADKTVIVENRPGGNGEIATNYMMQTGKTDTVFMVVGTVVNFAVKPSLSGLDIEAVADVGQASMVLVVPSSSKINKFQDLIALDKNQSLTYSNGGKASLSYIAGESLKYHMNKNFVGVSYQNAPKMLIDLIPGRLDFGIVHVNDVIQYIDQKQLTPLAVFSESRVASLPNVPTVKEFGIKDSVIYSHYIVIGPTSNSRSDVALVQTTLTKSLADSVRAQPYRTEGLHILSGNKALDQSWWKKELVRSRDLITRIKLQTE